MLLLNVFAKTVEKSDKGEEKHGRRKPYEKEDYNNSLPCASKISNGFGRLVQATHLKVRGMQPMMLILLCILVILWISSLCRIMQILKKTPVAILLCLVVCFALTSCSNTQNINESAPDSYSLYSQYVDELVKNFEPSGFEMLNSTADIYSSGFPENEYFKEQDDLYDGDPLKPQNRKAVYLDSNDGVLVCMTFLYSEEELGKRMLTIDSLPTEAIAAVQKEDNINIQETYEMVLEDQHCIMLLKFISTELLQSNQEQAVTNYRTSVIDFFEEYTQFLKSQENTEESLKSTE